MTIKRRWIAVALALVARPAPGSAIYKWVDEHGQLHLEQRPRPIPPVAQPPSGAGDASIDEARMPGHWRAQQREETIELRLDADGRCVWRVLLRGAPWSVQHGTWRIIDNRLEIVTLLGRTRYRVSQHAHGMTLVGAADAERFDFVPTD